ncbi:MAG TPA: MBL fold metallo-hydrolase [Flavisolibacter sp.]|nr:MBL fold metallo-hydrolase [Flavisolibacter sp.]
MKISFHGAARTVTGSKHIVTLSDGRRILLDCGMFQGLGAETEELNNHFGFNPQSIDVLLLSHAHIDHTGLIPKLVKEGFTGKIICTEATKELAEILLYDSAEIQTYETESINKKREKKGLPPYQPIYTADDVAQSLQQFETVPFDRWTSVMAGVDVLFTHTGHLIGSAAISLRIKEGRKKTTLLFTGDIGRYRSVLLQPPVETPQADYIIMESTYGDKRHDLTFNTIETLHKWINRICVQKGGQLIIPAFSVGRTQEVLYALNQLSLEKRLPELLYFIDSPLSLKATEIIKKYKDQYNERLQQVLEIDNDPFDFPGLKYVESVEDSRKLVDYKEPCVIISASGTADAGRVRHHINDCIGNRNNAVLFVGYCSAKSLGGQLLSGTKEVEIFNDACAVAAEVGQLFGMSGHGDTDDLTQYLSSQHAEKVKGIFLVHGEHEVQKAFCERLQIKGFNRVEVPSQHEEFPLPLPRKRKRIMMGTSVSAERNGTNFSHLTEKQPMDEKQDSRHTPYNGESSAAPHRETGDSDIRNNNMNVTSPHATVPNVKGANDAGIGDSAANDQKLTKHTSNHSADAQATGKEF